MATTPTKIAVYDAEFNLKGKTLSPYTLRVTFLLDYKKIPYDIVRIQFHEIEATAKAVGAAPTRTNADGNPGYTIPFAIFEYADKPKVVISDSMAIAHFIEGTYPDPDGKIFPTDTRVFQSIFSKYLPEKIYFALSKVTMPFSVQALPERAREHVLKTRVNVHGKTAEEYSSKDGIEEAWKNVEAAFDDLAAHLDKAGQGNFRVTGGPSYAEFELVSLLNMIPDLSPEGWKRLGARNGGRWAKLWELPLYQGLLPANRA